MPFAVFGTPQFTVDQLIAAFIGGLVLAAAVSLLLDWRGDRARQDRSA